jgi:anti-sigma factor RsiW
MLTARGGTAMGHDEAVRTFATEKYLLGELNSELRNQFEEHLFRCPRCAFDVWAAATFLEHARVVLSKQA